jgi:hypothetical protein
VQRKAVPNDHDAFWAGIVVAVVIVMVTALFWLLAASSMV